MMMTNLAVLIIFGMLPFWKINKEGSDEMLLPSMRGLHGNSRRNRKASK